MFDKRWSETELEVLPEHMLGSGLFDKRGVNKFVEEVRKLIDAGSLDKAEERILAIYGYFRIKGYNTDASRR